MTRESWLAELSPLARRTVEQLERDGFATRPLNPAWCRQLNRPWDPHKVILLLPEEDNFGRRQMIATDLCPGDEAAAAHAKELAGVEEDWALSMAARMPVVKRTLDEFQAMAGYDETDRRGAASETAPCLGSGARE